MDVIDVIDDDKILECEDCRFAPDLISMHDGNKYFCSECSRIYDTELGDTMKHHLQLWSEVDDIITAESSEPMIVNFTDQYYAAKTSNNNNNNSKKSDEFIPEDKFLKKRGITILEEHTTHYDNVEWY